MGWGEPYDSAYITWRTDEPTTTYLAWGSAPGNLTNVEDGPEGQFLLEHGVQLSGLSPSTTYYVQVEATDPDGNGPTVSAVIPFTTPDLPDTAPPVITGLEIVGIAHDQATVTWQTDEPAIGGVSYNDGVRYFVVDDPTPRTEHSITLPDLDALTGYFVTVSATDTVGNGPTLAGPVSFTTAEAPDTTPPTISNIVVECDTQTCTCTWDTDEVASASISFGLAGSGLNGIVASTAFTADHELTLGGLTPGSNYQLVIQCTDPSGNVASSTTIDFGTVVHDTDGDGIPDDVDTCPLDADNDSDQDGICGDVDNCPDDPAKVMGFAAMSTHAPSITPATPIRTVPATAKTSARRIQEKSCPGTAAAERPTATRHGHWSRPIRRVSGLPTRGSTMSAPSTTAPGR